MYPQRGGYDVTCFFNLFIHSFTFILIIVPLYRRNFCDGHIILVCFCNAVKFELKKREREKVNLETPSYFNILKMVCLMQFTCQFTHTIERPNAAWSDIPVPYSSHIMMTGRRGRRCTCSDCVVKGMLGKGKLREKRSVLCNVTAGNAAAARRK